MASATQRHRLETRERRVVTLAFAEAALRPDKQAEPGRWFPEFGERSSCVG